MYNVISVPTSSAVQAIISNPMYEKKTVAEPDSTPLIPLGKYLSKGENQEITSDFKNEITELIFFWLSTELRYTLQSRNNLSIQSGILDIHQL